MQEVITKTIVILAALVAIVLVFNRLGRSSKLKGGCGCGTCQDTSSPCKDCSQASGCDTPSSASSKSSSDQIKKD